MEHVDKFMVFESLVNPVQRSSERNSMTQRYPERISMYMIATVIDY